MATITPPAAATHPAAPTLPAGGAAAQAQETIDGFHLVIEASS
jgi:hypothetical protein